MKEKISFVRIAKYVIPAVTVLAFVATMIPILYLGQYDFATGDDYGYGYRAHLALLSSGSPIEVIKALFETVRVYYYAWQGTWFTVFLMSLQPEVFSAKAYWITPWLMSAINLFSTAFILNYLNKKYVRLPFGAYISITILTVMGTIQYYPSTASGVFWFNGGAHYIIPYGMAMVAIWAILNFRETGAKRYWILTTVLMTLLGGASYLVPLLVVIVLGYLWIWDIIRKQNKHMLTMIIPTVLEIIGLVISFTAPGTAIRAENESGGDLAFSAGAIVSTVFRSLQYALVGIKDYLCQSPFVIVCLIGVGIVSALYLITFSSEDEDEGSGFEFPLPGVFVVLMFCAYAAMYAPGVFSRAELSGGVPNTIFQVFMLTTALSIVYCVGWFSIKCKSRSTKENGTRKIGIQLITYILIVIACMGWLVVARGTLKEATTYECIEYVKSGRADDYRNQILHNYSILLDDTISDAVILPISDEQGPLMHMPIVSDEENFTNVVAREFFNKHSVTVDY